MVCQLRSAAETDTRIVYQFICSLEEEILDFDIFNKIFILNILNNDYYYIVAESSDNVVGYISCHTQYLLHHCGKVAEIQELFVAEDHRGKGIGKLLVNSIEEKLREAGCVSFEVTANNKRNETHQFYISMGFGFSHKKFIKSLI